MIDKRFGVTPEMPKDWVDIIDTDNNQTLCNIRVEYSNNMIKLLNELHEENQSYKQKVENTLLEFYKLYEGQIFWEIADELEFDLEKALKGDLE